MPDNGELNNQAQRVQQAAERGMVLTEELEGSAGHQPVRRAPCCIRRLLENFTSEQLERLPSHVTLASHCSELPSDMAIDAVNLKKSLGEIIDNATRAAGRTPLALTLTASTAQITPQERACMLGATDAPSELLWVSLADDGAGIPQRHISRIFDPFFSTNIRARGLGLPVLLGSVLANQGLLALRTAHNQGTEIALLLPYAPTND